MWRCAVCDGSQMCVCVCGGVLAADDPDGLLITGVYK